MARCRFKGLMTIGKQGDTSAFETMSKLKAEMCGKYELKAEDFELSMGMSGDFERAVMMRVVRSNSVPRA